jgi:hypothetical protein
MLKLDPNLEELRDTLFHSMIKGMLVFDDIPSAVNFKRAQIREQKAPPTIYTLTGDKLTSDGMMNPRKGQGKISDRLEYVFGQSKPDMTEEFQLIEGGE